jgi:hypothetical protein
MRSEVTYDRVMALLEHCPTATVALYAGGPGDHSGSLLVAARAGLHAAREVIEEWPRVGNVVDGPALRWLSRQQPPRIWVSDGMVTGMNDHSDSDLSLEVERLLSTAHIRRVPSLDHYLEDKENS